MTTFLQKHLGFFAIIIFSQGMALSTVFAQQTPVRLTFNKCGTCVYTMHTDPPTCTPNRECGEESSLICAAESLKTKIEKVLQAHKDNAVAYVNNNKLADEAYVDDDLEGYGYQDPTFGYPHYKGEIKVTRSKSEDCKCGPNLQDLPCCRFQIYQCDYDRATSPSPLFDSMQKATVK